MKKMCESASDSLHDPELDENWGMDDGGPPAVPVYEHTNDLSVAIDAGQRVRDLRNLDEISPELLAEFAMIDVKDLLAIEAGILLMNKDLATQLATGLGVELEVIWEGEQPDRQLAA